MQTPAGIHCIVVQVAWPLQHGAELYRISVKVALSPKHGAEPCTHTLHCRLLRGAEAARIQCIEEQDALPLLRNTLYCFASCIDLEHGAEHCRILVTVALSLQHGAEPCTSTLHCRLHCHCSTMQNPAGTHCIEVQLRHTDVLPDGLSVLTICSDSLANPKSS